MSMQRHAQVVRPSLAALDCESLSGMCSAPRWPRETVAAEQIGTRATPRDMMVNTLAFQQRLIANHRTKQLATDSAVLSL